MARPLEPIAIFLIGLLASPTVVGQAHAQPQPGAAESAKALQKEARQRFDRGLELFEQGENTQALAEFERAYALVPNSAVLFNMGLVYAAMNRPVEAVDALDRVLESPGSLPPERLERARQVQKEQARRISTLTVTTNVPAMIEIDGVESGHTPLSAPLRIKSGSHVIGAVSPGYLPVRRELTLAEATQEKLDFTLEPAAREPAHLAITSSLSAVSLRVDDEEHGTTPFAGPVSVAPGARHVTLSRRGYRTLNRELTLKEGETFALDATLAEDPNAPSSDRGRLVLKSPGADIEITLDGTSRGYYRAPIVCPIGPHLVRLARAGFEPSDNSVNVTPGADTELAIPLRQTPETRQAILEHSRAQKRWALIAGGAGILLGAAGSYFYISGRQTLSDANADIDKLNASSVRGANGECDPATEARVINHCDERSADASSRADHAIVQRDIGIVGIGLGAASLVTSVVLLLTAPNESPNAESAERGRKFEPMGPHLSDFELTWSAQATGPALLLRGVF